MTLIIDALARVQRACRFTAPASWVTATEDDPVQVRDDFLPATVDDILARVDLPSPIGKQTVITGDDSENYSLPSDFLRLTRDPLAVYETTTSRRAGFPVNSDGAWTHLKEIGTAGTYRYYRVKGYDGNFTIDFFQNPTSSVSITVSYVSKNWMATSGGTAGSDFTDETDVLLMPRRAVELGTIWRYRRDKGLPYEDVMNEYEAYLARLANDSRKRQVINFGAGNPEYARPWDIPVPDYIPST